MGSESISRSPYAAGDLNVADILLDLRRRGANLVSHGLKSLEQHLCGTRDVLTAWHQPLRVCLAGFLHSGYSTDSFEHPLFDIGNRSQMRELIGKEAEKIVYVFCSIQRQDLFDALRQRGGEISEHLMLANRRGGPALTLTRRDVGDLLVLYMANTAEQSCVSDGAPGRWIAHAAKLGWWAKNLAVVVPPVFDGCTAIVSEESEDHLLEGYSAALRNVAANPGGAMANLAEAVAGAACVPEPLIWWGFLSIAAGDAETGADLGARAKVLLDEWGTPWDKRLTLLHWRTLATLLNEAAGRRGEEFSFVRERVRTALSLGSNSPARLYANTCNLFPDAVEMERQVPSPLPIARSTNALPSRFEEYIAPFRSNQELPRIYDYYPGLTAKPWYDARQFPLARDLERAAPEIGAELRRLDTRLFLDEAEDIRREGRWSVLFLDERGHRNKEICDLCPLTVSVIDAHAAVTSMAGNSYFSCLDPGTRVAPHRGPTNMRLRCHLGIEIPDQCGLKVDGIEGTWAPGRCVVFDDSFVHEVWNLSDSRRVVLIVDMWHPDLTGDEVNLLKWVSA